MSEPPGSLVSGFREECAQDNNDTAAHMRDFFVVLLVIGGLVASPAGGAPFAWIANDLGVAVIDVETSEIVRRIEVENASSVTSLPGHAQALVFRSDGFVTFLHSVALAPTAHVPTAGAAQGGYLVPGQQRAYVVVDPAGAARALDLETRTFTGSAPGNLNNVLAFSEDGGLAYFGQDGSGPPAVVEVATRTNELVRHIPLATHASTGALHPNATRRLYLASATQGAITVLDLDTGAVVSTIPTSEPGFQQLLFDPRGTLLFALTGDSVVVLDATTHARITSIPVGEGARSVDVTSTGRLYVVNGPGGYVSIIDTALLRVLRTVSVGRHAAAGTRFIGGITRATVGLPGVASGLWWNPAEPGWGMHLTQRGDTFFAALFHYTPAGAPKWFVASSCVPNTPLSCPDCLDNVTCQGTIYDAEGPPLFRPPFEPGAVRTREVGIMEIGFTDRNRASLTYVIEGRHRRVDIERQVFAPATPLAVDYTDLWWNPLESGWGLGITQRSNVMFLTWFVYDDLGLPVWYVSSACAVEASGNGCRGALYRTAGPLGPVPGNGFDTAALRVTEVGTIEAAFDTAISGVITYTIGGRSGSKAITRQLF